MAFLCCVVPRVPVKTIDKELGPTSSHTRGHSLRFTDDRGTFSLHILTVPSLLALERHLPRDSGGQLVSLMLTSSKNTPHSVQLFGTCGRAAKSTIALVDPI
ncbi:unnamed protein product [Dicrocoelium dendriticum]|nr:unnamed protein product [Dicrocoelium dendriticum]